MGIGCGLLLYLAIAGAFLWALWLFIRWLFFRPVVVAGDAKLVTECTTCKYSLEGLGTSPTCPECSTKHATIYTTHLHTEWRLRYDLFWHWVVAALLCVGLWWLVAYAFPPVMTAVVYWFKGWPAAQRVEQLMASHRYPWYPTEFAFVMALAWFAAAALSLRCRLRTLAISIAVGAAATILVTVCAAFVSKNWQGDWYSYFWDLGPNPAAATVGTLSVITIVACMLIDAAAYANRKPISNSDAAISVSATPNVITSDSEASRMA